VARLSLSFLNTFQAILEAKLITQFRSSKNKGLLVYLALQYERSFPREVLATLFWPEESESNARINLRQSLHQLRKVLGDLENPGEAYLLVTRQTVQFNADSDFILDVDHFLQSIEKGDLEAAVAGYHGDLLQFEDWLRLEREHLHQVALEAMFEVTEGYLRTGQLDKAQAVARHQLTLEPWREPAYRQLMQAYALAGDRSNALAQFEVCREILWEELGVEPAAETIALYESIKVGTYDLIAADESLEKPVEHRHNLPAYAAPFIGREEELEKLDGFIADPSVRLVTIVGPGGIGKTRLATSAAERVLAAGLFPKGVFFIDLAPLQETSRIVQAVADTLNFPLQGGDDRSSRQQLLDYLHQKKLLLVFDNFEHLLDGAELLADILQSGPEIKILVTSRERLHLLLEQVYPLDGLAFPDLESAEDAAEYMAVLLFLQSARRNQPDFALRDDDDLIHLTRICRMVEGMPLALELAAAWVDMLSLDEIASELQQGIDILETELRDVLARQRSVRASFDYSWRLLDEAEQVIFAQLSIFRGGFTRAAVQEVTGASLRQLSNLLNKSLIRFDMGRDRYEIHELLRQFGTEKLALQPELEASTYDHHSSYYLQMMAGFTENLKGKGKRQALSAIEADLKNVLLAWDHACAQQNIEAIGMSLESLWRSYWDFGRRELREFEQAAANLRNGEAIGERGIVLGRLLAPLGRSYQWRGDTAKAREMLEESLDLLQRLGATEESLIPLLFLAEVQDSKEESNQLYREGLALARAVGDPWAVGHALVFLVGNARLTGNYQEARQLGREALEQFRQNGDKAGMAVSLYELSLLAVDMGQYEEAVTLARESVSITQGFNPMIRIMGLFPLGLALYALGEYGEAEEQFLQFITVQKEFGREDWKFPLFLLGEIAFRKREYARAAQLYEDSLATAAEFGNLQLVIRNHLSLGSVNVAQGGVIEARKHLHAALQTAIKLNWRPLLLDCFVGIAELLSEEGDLGYAAMLATLTTTDPASRAMTKERGEHLLVRIKKDLSFDEMDTVRQRSRSIDLDTVAAQLLVDLETP
jgi:predicted ATPase/DNA-binding SARP family transcriptional activator/TolA-binding protein